MKPMIALCDMRSFYASAERVFEPGLRDKPVAVASNNDGCIVALTTESKMLGVRKFQPVFLQQTLIKKHGIVVRSSNYALYQAISNRIIATLQKQVPSLIPYSIDEVFADFEGIKPEELKPLGHHLKQLVWKEQRIPMGVSIAPTKTLAKLGQYALKELPRLQGVVVLEHPHQYRWLGDRTPVAEVWGVGRRLNTKLNGMGIYSASELMKLDPGVAAKTGGFPLEMCVRELNGISCINLDDAPPPNKQIICSRSFGKKLTTLKALQEAVADFACQAGEKARKQGSRAGRLSVWLCAGNQEGSYLSDSNSINLAGGCSDSRRLAEAATSICASLYRSGAVYRKAGVALTDLRPKELWQQDIFNNYCENSALMGVMDSINRKYGRGKAMIGRQAGKSEFVMKQEMLSPRYLTRWEDIPCIQC